MLTGISTGAAMPEAVMTAAATDSTAASVPTDGDMTHTSERKRSSEDMIEDALTPQHEDSPTAKRKRLDGNSAPPSEAVAPTVVRSGGLQLDEAERSMNGAPEGELFLVNVLAREEFSPATDVHAEMREVEALIAARKNGDDGTSELSWAQEYQAVDSFRRIAIHHPAELRQIMYVESRLQAIPLLIVPAVSNLRSAMTRNALFAIEDTVLTLHSETTSHLADIVPVLVNRAANEKQFIRELARKVGRVDGGSRWVVFMCCSMHVLFQVLDTLVNECKGSALLLALLRAATGEKNAQAVSAAGIYCSKCVEKMDRVQLKQCIRAEAATFFPGVATLLSCRVVQCKAATRKLLQTTRQIAGSDAFVAATKAQVSGSVQFDILRASEDKRPSKATAAPRMSMRERMMQLKKQQATKKQPASDGVTDSDTATATAVVLAIDGANKTENVDPNSATASVTAAVAVAAAVTVTVTVTAPFLGAAAAAVAGAIMSLQLPMIKLGGLIVRTLTKPLAKVVKSRSKVHPGLNAVCRRIGQHQHRMVFHFHMAFRGVSNYVVKDLPDDQAAEKGADFIGEMIIFSVAVIVASVEYTRSSAKTKEKDRIAQEMEQQAHQQLNDRFEALENKVIWLEAKLAELGHIVEADIDKRLEEADEEDCATASSTSALLTALTMPAGNAPAIKNPNGSGGNVWRVTYEAVAGLFR
ncbi:TPA: hypothetical protein N0F65_004357 [Lagenidium giganteum]|uniref:Transmembrane protein n=1 Tax=Lagenidium giganteum TaxID=4803 RepID=A0AAV2YI18_9STRA|nr:TPA: hypothetical protein N0F65_004357 [Lagenidium giganteum]